MASREDWEHGHGLPTCRDLSSQRHVHAPDATLDTPELVNDACIRETGMTCSSVQVNPPQSCYPPSAHAHPTKQPEPFSIPPSPTVEDQPLSRPTSFNDEGIHCHDPLASIKPLPTCSAFLEEKEAFCSSENEVLSTTKSLRKGNKAHRRAATIPAVFLADFGGDYASDRDSQQSVEHEFAIRLKIYERVDFESVPSKSSLLKLRTMRASLRERMIAITARLTART